MSSNHDEQLDALFFWTLEARTTAVQSVRELESRRTERPSESIFPIGLGSQLGLSLPVRVSLVHLLARGENALFQISTFRKSAFGNHVGINRRVPLV